MKPVQDSMVGFSSVRELLFAKGCIKNRTRIKQPKLNFVTVGRDSSFPHMPYSKTDSQGAPAGATHMRHLPYTKRHSHTPAVSTVISHDKNTLAGKASSPAWSITPPPIINSPNSELSISTSPDPSLPSCKICGALAASLNCAPQTTLKEAVRQRP